MDVLGWLRANRVSQGDLVGLAVAADGSVALAVPDGELATTARAGPARRPEIRPRWVVWSQETARRLVGDGVRVTTCWDVAAVQRLRSGRWRADPEYVWARLHGVPDDQVPAASSGEPDLFSVAAERAAGKALGAAEALAGGGAPAGRPRRVGRRHRGHHRALGIHGRTALRGAGGRRAAGGPGGGRGSAGGDHRTAAARAADAAGTRAARDGVVLGHAPAGATADLRSPGQVRSLLAAAGIDVPDTRAYRLEEFRDSSPLVAALLDWRKAERIATTYGYAWLDENLGPDGRLRGTWTGCDGAAGRMTASSGLHNMPAVLRRAVIAQPGHVFVRADLGQIEPGCSPPSPATPR